MPKVTRFVQGRSLQLCQKSPGLSFQRRQCKRKVAKIVLTTRNLRPTALPGRLKVTRFVLPPGTSEQKSPILAGLPRILCCSFQGQHPRSNPLGTKSLKLALRSRGLPVEAGAALQALCLPCTKTVTFRIGHLSPLHTRPITVTFGLRIRMA